MKRLNRLQTALFGFGGALMVIGAGCFCFMWQQVIASSVFLVGAILFGVLQCMQIYEGKNFTITRLKNIMNLADLLFIISGVFMVDTALSTAYMANGGNGTVFLLSFFGNVENYYEYVYNKWLPLMLIAVVLEMYTTHRISSELKKEQIEE